eukprot:6597176-Pyramimonas_sp.AAC.1
MHMAYMQFMQAAWDGLDKDVQTVDKLVKQVAPLDVFKTLAISIEPIIPIAWVDFAMLAAEYLCNNEEESAIRLKPAVFTDKSSIQAFMKIRVSYVLRALVDGVLGGGPLENSWAQSTPA